MDTKTNSYKKTGIVGGRESRITTLREDRKTIGVDASEKPKETTADENQTPSLEFLLQRLLAKAETSARKNEISRKRWQLVSFVSLMLFAAAFFTCLWVYMEVNALTKDQDTLRMDKHTLTEQLQLAGTKVSEFSWQIDLLKNQNDRFAIENANLKTQNGSLSTRAESLSQSAATAELKQPAGRPIVPDDKTHQPKPTPQDQRRLNAIQEGNYPQDMTRTELTAALGEPDRIYKDEVYEQLVYFDRAPGRFWFKNGPFLRAAE